MIDEKRVSRAGARIVSQWLVAAMLWASGCREDRPAPAPVPERASPAVAPGEADASRGCELTIEGTFAGTGRTPLGRSSFSSEYYYDDAELRAWLAAGRPPGPEVSSYVDEIMQREVRRPLLMMRCATPRVTVLIGEAVESTKAQIPFAPGRYTFDEAPGHVRAVVSVTGGDEGPLSTFTTGTFELDKFDRTGARGVFHAEVRWYEPAGADAPSVARTMTLNAHFDYPCPDPALAMCRAP